MRRRDFMRTGIGVLGAALLPGRISELWAEETSSVHSRVWLAQGDPGAAARALVEAIGGLKPLLPENGVVLIKPNIAFPAPPQWGATTDPDFLAAVIDLCLQAGAKRVIIVDHPVGSSTEKNLERSGIGAVCQARPQATILIANQEKQFRSCEIPQGKTLKSAKIASILDKVDLFINLPTAKHHSATGVSLGLKNLMGLVWDRAPFHEELDLHQAIADLATVIRPQLTLLEARYALLTNGPTGPGQVEEVGKYLAGFDPVAVDAMGVELANWEGRIQKGAHIAHLQKAHEQGLGEIENDRIELIHLS
ncbi:MAG: DUF362 domain-containing protein [bacterium]